MPTTRRTKGAILAPVYDDPMPRKPRSRATSVASSQRSDDGRARSEMALTDEVAGLTTANRLESQNEELMEENNALRKQLERQKNKKWTLRDKQLAEELAAHQAEQNATPAKREADNEKQSHDEVTSHKDQQTPRQSSSSTVIQSEIRTENHRTFTIPLADSPSTPATVPRWKQLVNSTLGSFSPFRRSTNSDRAQTPTQSTAPAESPLKPLPSNRKRSAPSEEGEKEQANKRANTPEKNTADKDQPKQSFAKLAPVAEQGENTQRSVTRETQTSTPTRASRKRNTVPRTEKPKRTTDKVVDEQPASTMKRRTLRDARSARQSRIPSNTPMRHAWEVPVKPRIANADERLAKLQELEMLRADQERIQARLAALQRETEEDGIDTRKRKRVKVDELVHIPHNQPGDAPGTFRLPEWDSDDEMEVDDDAQIRKNVFVQNMEQEKQKATTTPTKPAPARVATPIVKPFDNSKVKAFEIQKPSTEQASMPPASLFAPAKQPAQAVQTSQPNTPFQAQPRATNIFEAQQTFKPAEPVVKKPAKKFDFPTVGPRNHNDVWPQERKIAAGQQFKRMFDVWIAEGMPMTA